MSGSICRLVQILVRNCSLSRLDRDAVRKPPNDLLEARRYRFFSVRCGKIDDFTRRMKALVMGLLLILWQLGTRCSRVTHVRRLVKSLSRRPVTEIP